MKLITGVSVRESMMKEFMMDGYSKASAEIAYNNYIYDAYNDFHRYHKKEGTHHAFYEHPTEQDHQFCMWCNLYANIRDVDRKQLECLERPRNTEISCVNCLKNSTWYKKIL